MNATVSLQWPPYELFPYERSFALAEAEALLRPQRMRESPASVEVETLDVTAARRLTYFQGFQYGSNLPESTTQHLIESETSGGARRQSTRYSVHGLHEYKGKFNPQTARALLNSAGLEKGAAVLDPFCGSGTTLVECAHAGLRAVGTDVNPLAAMLANAKLAALASDPDEIVAAAEGAVRSASRTRAVPDRRGTRAEYLARWFEATMLTRLEALRAAILNGEKKNVSTLLAIASNILREFSLQEPEDLRIRRRTSPSSVRDPYEVFIDQARSLASNVAVVQRHLGRRVPKAKAHHSDTRTFAATAKKPRPGFDAAITSPPYAMALPYIDTQRLSLVWLELVDASDLPSLQAELIGSREFNGSPRGLWERRLKDNADGLPAPHIDLCLRVMNLLGRDDGFRRQAVPSLLYRYLAGMRDSFLAIRSLLREGAPFFLIIGHNHTTLGGQRIDIDTPLLLALLGESTGFTVADRQVLQTYQRYGLHQKNAIGREELLTLRGA